jgi:putative sterol carrier protein
MIDKIFASLPDSFVPGVIEEPLVYYFSLGAAKKTVRVDGQSCTVEDGRTVDEADCVCKTDETFFVSIWSDGFRPSMGDFLSGKIKSNNPTALQLFLQAFGKQ